MKKIHRNSHRKETRLPGRGICSGDILNITFILSMAFLITLILYYWLLLPSLPEAAARAYINCLSDGGYEKASSFLINIPSGMTDTDELSAALRDTYGNCESISIVNLSMPVNSKLCDATVDAEKDGSHNEVHMLLYNSKDSIFHFKKEWKVICPFEVSDVVFKGIDGTRVFMDNEELGTIQGGKLNCTGLICCTHDFKFQLDDIGESPDIRAAVYSGANEIKLNIEPLDGFSESMKKVISGFGGGWEQYCLTMKADSMKPYLTEKMFKEYTSDRERFKGSKYVICQGEIDFKDLRIEDGESVYYTVDERWHIKESITDRTFVFKDNGKAQLDQVQYLSWNYHIIKDGAAWKINSADQLSYRQEILNP